MRPLALLLLVALPWAPPAAADEAPHGDGRFDGGGPRLLLDVEFGELFDEPLRRRLDSGFATTVVVRCFLTRDGASRPEALAARTTRVAYDLWDEVYVGEEQDAQGSRTFREPSRAEVVRRLTRLTHFPVAETARLEQGQRYVVALRVEVNPVSPELHAQLRRWLTRAPEGPRFSSGGESFFGSFVSIFVNPLPGEAERVLRRRLGPYAHPLVFHPAGPPLGRGRTDGGSGSGRGGR